MYTNKEIESLIDENNFDDFYVVNPDTLVIKVEELNNLLDYFETKSVRNNGRRVYVIYGIERLKNDISNTSKSGSFISISKPYLSKKICFASSYFPLFVVKYTGFSIIYTPLLLIALLYQFYLLFQYLYLLFKIKKDPLK